MKMYEWVPGSEESCPSCEKAAGQIHPLEVWNRAGISPGCEKLFCGKSCKCRFEKCESEKEVGRVEDIPVRGENGAEPMATETAAAGAADDTNQTRLAVTGEVGAGGAFEVMAITAGEGNGWQFSADALRDSLALWDGAECFVDHAWFSRSLRDLAGVLDAPEWDATRQGIKCKLKPLGPSAPLLSELGKQMLSEGKTPRVGFSADVVFTAQGRKVQKILRVLSVDLVFNPARGGAFLRALNSVMPEGVLSMPDEVNPSIVEEPGTAAPAAEAALSEEMQTAQLGQTLERQTEVSRAVHAEMCGYLLDSGLAASKLPQAVQERIRKQFAGNVFEPGELTAAIEDGRKLVSDLAGASIIQGPGRVHGMFSSEDQYTAALFDLLGVERPEEVRDVKAAKLSGIRELYTLMTGDYGFIGGYDPERVQFSITADLPNVLKNAMNKLIVQEWQELGRSGYRWWEPIVDRQHFNSLQEITGILVGEVTALPVVAEGAPYAALSVTDSGEVGSWTKYGGYVGLTLEMFERDETHKLRQYPKKLASAGLRRVSALVGEVFTANGGVGPNMADNNPVFGAARGNLGVAALSAATWEEASSTIYNQDLLAGIPGIPPKQAVDAKYLIVPRALRLTGMQLLYPNMEHTVNIHSENMQRGEMGDVITCPEFSDANDWAAVADPRIAPAIILAERYGVLPELIIADRANNGALFTNDEIRMKARHWLAVFVADYRPLYKANVV